MITSIKKRDGRIVPFDQEKIEQAIEKSFMASGSQKSQETAQELAGVVVQEIERDENLPAVPSVEQVQDVVERVLIERRLRAVRPRAYILYRAERSRVREMNTRLMKIFEDITYKDAIDSDIKRENANIDGDTAMGTMLKYGSEGAKQFYEMYVLNPEHARRTAMGDIHIHDLDFYTLTTTCCQIDLLKLFHGGFSTGHGVLREPQRHLQLFRPGVHRHPVQPERPARRPERASTLTTAWRRASKRPISSGYRDNLARALELLGNVRGRG